MGCFSHSCYLSGMPITYGSKAVLIVMKPVLNTYDCSDESLRKYGKSFLCSNDTSRIKFMPCWFPIMGEYNDYGSLENIIKDDNTKILEEFYGLTIEQLVHIVTSGRKGDGFDDDLKVIKENGGKSEEGEPNYKKEYLELLTYSAMWVHGDLYNDITDKARIDYFEHLDLGMPELLGYLGFKFNKIHDNLERYNQEYNKGNVTVFSDGTWLHIPGEHIYQYSDFAAYCKEKGETIDISKITEMDRVEQVFELVVPTTNIIPPNKTKQDIEGFIKRYLAIFTKSTVEEAKNFFMTQESHYGQVDDRHGMGVLHYFLNGKYSERRIYNPITVQYINNGKEGKLRDNLVRFWRFDKFMYSMGKYYNIIGTAPQDGDNESVLFVLESAVKILKEKIAENEEWDEEDDD